MSGDFFAQGAAIWHRGCCAAYIPVGGSPSRLRIGETFQARETSKFRRRLAETRAASNQTAGLCVRSASFCTRVLHGHYSLFRPLSLCPNTSCGAEWTRVVSNCPGLPLRVGFFIPARGERIVFPYGARAPLRTDLEQRPCRYRERCCPWHRLRDRQSDYFVRLHRNQLECSARMEHMASVTPHRPAVFSRHPNRRLHR